MTNLSSFIPQLGLALANYSGKQAIDRLGVEVIQEAVASVLCGYNIRALTETLTRRRLALSNGAMVKTFLDAASNIENFSNDLISILKKELVGSTTDERKIFLSWISGLTNKGVQNVLRGDETNLDSYLDEFKECIENAATVCKKEYGDLSGQLKFDKTVCMIDWLLMSYLSAAIGAQTLAIRGSEKAMYGKMFEPLVLATLLQLLGFEKISPTDHGKSEKVFWLSHRKAKRESDATLLYKLGRGIYFDIGFIGPGNPEITLDKVTRFENHIRHGKRSYKMSTIIIVDRIGEGSRIVRMASDVHGHVVQMSMSHWVKEVAQILYKVLGHKHEILRIKTGNLESYIRKRVKELPMYVD